MQRHVKSHDCNLRASEDRSIRTMTCQRTLAILLTMASIVSGGERLFTSGPQEFAGRRYYWLAEWKLEIALPEGVVADDRLEVLFGTKGSGKRTLFYEYNGRSGLMAHGFAWVALPLDGLETGKTVLLYGKGRERVAFLAGVRVKGEAIRAPEVKPIRAVPNPQDNRHAATWAKLPGFEINSETTRLWDLSPEQPDWRRASAGCTSNALRFMTNDPACSVPPVESGTIAIPQPTAIRSTSGQPTTPTRNSSIR